MRSLCNVAVAIVAVTGCGREREPEPPQIVMVKGTAAQEQAVRDSVAPESDAELVRILPQSRAQAWQVPGDSVAEFERLARERGFEYVESFRQGTNPVIADGSVQISQLSLDQRRIVDRFTQGLSPDTFRVSAERPAETSFELFGVSIDTGVDAVMPVRLPDDRVVEFVRTAVERREKGLTWFGRIRDGDGRAIFVVDRLGVTGTITLPDGVFSLLPLPEGRQLIFRKERQEAPPEHPPDSPSGGRGQFQARADAPPVEPCGAAQASVDVLVVYTRASAAALPAVASEARLAFTELQQSFASSRIPTQLRLVGTIQEVPVAETPNDFSKALQALAASPDVAKLRDAAAADLVVMAVSGRQYAGLAGEILATPDTAFAIVSLYWMTEPWFTFGHEIGHLFGGRHDPATDPAATPFAYGHGYVDPQGEWRTIMAYDLCACPRVGLWANPLLHYAHNGSAGRPAGEASQSDDARVIRTTARRLGQFRCAPN